MDSPEKQELWLPGQTLDHVYTVPTNTELIDHWSATHDHSNVIESPGVFGALRTPDAAPRVVVSIDLCEVLRSTLHSMAAVFGKVPSEIGSYSTYGPNFGVSSSLDRAIVQVLMNHGHVEPNEAIEEISQTLQSWREQDAYCVANTSTLPGCEIATISFLDEYLPGCFDGILLPRNHDGKAPITKGHALRFAIEELTDIEDTSALHIDDAPHHCVAVAEHVGGLIGRHNVTTIMPLYRDAKHPEGTLPASTPVDAFRQADQVVRQLL